MTELVCKHGYRPGHCGRSACTEDTIADLRAENARLQECVGEAQGLLRECHDLHNWYVEGEKDGQHTENCLGCRVDSFLRSKEASHER
jgi:hypothetical protein